MSTTIRPAYGTTAQSITVTFTSLANNGARSGLAVDNTSNKFMNAKVQLKVKSGASSVSASGLVNVYAYGTSDSGTPSYPEGCGTDTGVTLTSPTNLRLIGSINVVANATTYISEPMSVAGPDGVLDDHWGICIENKTGAALDASIGSAWYQGWQLEAA